MFSFSTLETQLDIQPYVLKNVYRIGKMKLDRCCGKILRFIESVFDKLVSLKVT